MKGLRILAGYFAPIAPVQSAPPLTQAVREDVPWYLLGLPDVKPRPITPEWRREAHERIEARKRNGGAA